MALKYLLSPTFQTINTAGKPATGGYIEVYVHGTRDKYYCASDFEGTLHPFKIPLDSLGSNIILADDTHLYDVYVYNRYGTLMMSRYNVIPVGTGDGGGLGERIALDSPDNSIRIEAHIDQSTETLIYSLGMNIVEMTTDEVTEVINDFNY